MSCAVSCSTDSGVGNPAMAATFVAAGGGGVAGGGTGVTWTAAESAGVPGVWDAAGLLGMGSQAAVTASHAHSVLGLGDERLHFGEPAVLFSAHDVAPP